MISNCHTILRCIPFDASLSFRAGLTYRAATILRLVSNVFITLVYIFLWLALFQGKTEINGFQKNEMIQYVIATRMLKLLYPYSVSNNYGSLIKSGKIFSWLLKPIPLEVHLLSQSIGTTCYNLCFYCTPAVCLLIAFITLPSLKIVQYGVVFIWFASAYLFLFLLECCVGVVSYYTTSLWGINQFKAAILGFLAGELLPLSFYPAFFLNVFEKLPFVSVYYVPISILLGKVDRFPIPEFGVLLGSILVFFAVYRFLRWRMQKHIMIQGG